jgi:uncharacterized membrane protein YeaQ/YmgE (transglycosylase-associated protein family)
MNESEAATQTAAAVGGTVGLLIGLAIAAVVGLVIGALARFLLPGRDSMSLGKTMLYGVAGAVLGGMIGRLLGIGNDIVLLLIQVAVAMGLIWALTRGKAGG